MSLDASTRSVPARAALAGNPSDGHGGAVVSTVLPALGATVTAEASDRFEFSGSAATFASVREIGPWIENRERAGDHPLVQAAIAALHDVFDADVRPHRFEMSTTIPRSLGLAGSSAIVIATILAVVDQHGDAPWARTLGGHPELTASLALRAERDLLGIAAGLQDRVVQSLGGTVAMEFDDAHVHTVRGLDVGTYRSLGPLPDAMFVAYREDTGADSGTVHRGIEATDRHVRRAMALAADAGRAAADAVDRGDRSALGAAMDATFDQRALVFALDPRHVEMIEIARGCGASANYTGSGGSIIVLAPDARAQTALQAAGCTTVAI